MCYEKLNTSAKCKNRLQVQSLSSLLQKIPTFNWLKEKCLELINCFIQKKSDKKEIVEEVSFSNNKIMKSKKQHQLILFIKVDKI